MGRPGHRRHLAATAAPAQAEPAAADGAGWSGRGRGKLKAERGASAVGNALGDGGGVLSQPLLGLLTPLTGS